MIISHMKRMIIKYRTKNPYQDINDKYKMIFIHIPKNAGISVEEALFKKKVGHKTIRQFEAHDIRRFNSYFKFTVVRNPYDRLVSAFHFLKKGGRNEIDKEWGQRNLSDIEDFSVFLEKLKDKNFVKRILDWQHFRPQYEYLIDTSNVLCIDYIVKFENLEKDMEKVAKKLNLSHIVLEHKNKCKRDKWENYYETNTKKIVYELYKKDFVFFYKAFIRNYSA